jgi:hypothetical protein
MKMTSPVSEIYPDQNIARLTDNIAELDGLIAEYEAKRG